MKNIVFGALAEAARTGEPVTLGIISGVKGSSPQKVGAKALFYADGRIKGTLGGGCLEAEIQQRAVQALRTGESATFDLLLDHDFGWDDGLICGGKVLGLILPNAERAGEEFWKELAKREKEIAWGVGTDFSIRRVRAGEAKSQNPNPQIPKKFQTDKSQTQHHGEVFSAGPNRGDFSIGYLNPQTDEGDEEQDEAGADFRYLETVTPPSLLWIAGAGHIAQAVAPLAAQL